MLIGWFYYNEANGLLQASDCSDVYTFSNHFIGSSLYSGNFPFRIDKKCSHTADEDILFVVRKIFSDQIAALC